MGTRTTKIGSGLAVAGLYTDVQFLPRCEGCHSPHPSVVDPSNTSGVCAKCGTNVPEGFTRRVPGVITGWTPSAIAARFFLWAGDALRRLSRSI